MTNLFDASKKPVETVAQLNSTEKPKFTSLSNEVLLLVFDHLNFLDLCRVRGVSKRLRDLILDDRLVRSIEQFKTDLRNRVLERGMDYGPYIRPLFKGYRFSIEKKLRGRLIFPCYGCLRMLRQSSFSRDNVYDDGENCDADIPLDEREWAVSENACSTHGVFCKELCVDCVISHPAYFDDDHNHRRWMRCERDGERGYMVRCADCDEVTYSHDTDPGKPGGLRGELGICHECYNNMDDGSVDDGWTLGNLLKWC